MYDITVFGAEPHPNYNRIMLSPVLAERFLYSQKFAQVDPWKARAEGEAAHEFNKIEIRAA